MFLLELSLSVSLSLSLVIEWIISCQGPWNHTPNPELPFLLASKIFIRTIRSSDKASTEGWGACGREGRMCQQDVCSATLYTQTTDLSSSIWDTAASLFAPSQARQPGEGGTVPANPKSPTPTAPSRLCSVLAPGQEGLAAQHAQWEEGGTRASWLLHELTHRSRRAQKRGLISATQPARSLKNTEGGLTACGSNDL